ncbi:uncharacterized protein LOC115922885 [Strongylocentrotus purpuratus]|uniref:Transposase domain-containing protein n=1 Tax=Strongylocentrotus purpuratus TaxID=7668 RepID=A0A7M7NM43_STRPU|nr:uncharacterized protein LOC115922885 [Strongylocentrotus purpuratus]
MEHQNQRSLKRYLDAVIGDDDEMSIPRTTRWRREHQRIEAGDRDELMMEPVHVEDTTDDQNIAGLDEALAVPLPVTEDGANEEAEHVQSSESGPESVANHIDSDTDESPLESLAESGVSDIDENSLVSSAESADTDENVPEFVAEPVGANAPEESDAAEFSVNSDNDIPDGYDDQSSIPDSSDVGNISGDEEDLLHDDDDLLHDDDDLLHGDDSEGESTDNEPDGDVPLFENCNEPLFNGTQTTKAEAILMILSFVMRHCLSSIAAIQLCELINTLFGRAIFTSVDRIFKKVFSNQVLKLTFHFYCVSCYAYVKSYNVLTEDNLLCPHCTHPCAVNNLCHENFFITADLPTQVKSLFERPDITAHLSYRRNRDKLSPENIEDIYDGDIYKNMMADEEVLGNDNNFSYSFNTDGFPVFKSSRFSMWPIFLMINELPPKLRHNNLLLAGVWCGKSEPKMEVFLEQFVKKAKGLAEEGVSWKRGDDEVRSKLFGLCCCADAPARSSMQNTIRFNGYYGCSLCYHPGKVVERTVKYPIDVCEYNDRTDDEMLQDMALSMEENRPVKGVKGPSPLINLPQFPICWGFPVDFMHCLLLGVTRQLAELWFTCATNPFYIGSVRLMSVFDERLRSIKPPNIVARAPRPISERKSWKASEWYSWLLIYSLPCLNGILPREYWLHFLLLVQASYLLLQKSITLEDLHQSDLLLLEFVGKCQILYGAGVMTFNIHSLTHLAKCVQLWGPLWTHSCFPFEAANFRIKRQLKGNTGYVMQAVRKFLFIHSLPGLISKMEVSCQLLRYFDMVSPVLISHGYNDVRVLGNGHTRHLNDIEYEALQALGIQIYENEAVTVYNRIKVRGLFFLFFFISS